MKGFVLACFLASSLYGVSQNVLARNDDAQWQIVQKAAVAAHALSYQGIFVCQSGKQSTSVQIKHFFDGQNEYARNVLLDGSPREVLSQGDDLTIYNPKNEKIIIEKRRGQNMFPAVLPVNLSTVKQSYNLRIGQMGRVAGRDAQIVVLEPKDNLRYSYRLWIDNEYGLILKSVMFNSKNVMMDSISFTQLRLVNSVDLDWFTPKIDSKKNYEMEDEVPTKADFNPSPHWMIKELPAGYHKVDQMLRTVPGKTLPITHVVFSDGLASVSLFIEPLAKGAKPRAGHSVVGNTSYYSSVAGYLQVTVLGEVPEATVAAIANSVVFIK